MPKAKTVPTKSNKATKIIVNKSGKALKVKAPVKPITVKEQSKPIKKAPKAINISSQPPVTKRPSAQPKKPQTAYYFFNQEMQEQMKTMVKFKNMTLIEKNQVVAQSWSKLKQAQKVQYNKNELDDEKRYEKELKQLEKKGYFINQDGKDSRDLYKPARKPSKNDTEMKDDSPKKKSTKASKEDSKSHEMYDENGVKPKRPLTSFIYFSLDNRTSILKDKPDISSTDIAKLNGEAWKKLNEKQKKKYVDLNEKDQKRYQKEMKEFEKTGFFTNSDGISSKFLDQKHRVQEFEKGTVLPKQAMTPYLCYFKEQHNIFKTQKKDDEKYNVVEKTKQISETWSNLTTQKKVKYDKLSQKDHERYNQQLDDLRKNGFFTTEQGVKSTDLPFKQKRVKKSKQPDSPTSKE